MAKDDADDATQLLPIGEQGAELKAKIWSEKPGDEKNLFDPGAAMLGTDNEIGTYVDHDEMKQSLKAPQPKE